MDARVCVYAYVNNQLNYRQTHLVRRHPNLRLQIATAACSYTASRLLIICGGQKTRPKQAHRALRARVVNGISVTSGRKCALINAMSIAMLHVLARQETHRRHGAITVAPHCVYNLSKRDKSAARLCRAAGKIFPAVEYTTSRAKSNRIRSQERFVNRERERKVWQSALRCEGDVKFNGKLYAVSNFARAQIRRYLL